MDGKVLITIGGIVSPAGGLVVVSASAAWNKFTDPIEVAVVTIPDKIIAAKKIPKITLKVNLYSIR